MGSRRWIVAVGLVGVLSVAACGQADEGTSEGEVEVLGVTLDADDGDDVANGQPPFSQSETDSDVRRRPADPAPSGATEAGDTDMPADETDPTPSEEPDPTPPADGQPNEDDVAADDEPDGDGTEEQSEEPVSLADGFALHESRRQPDNSDDDAGWTATSSLVIDSQRPTVHGRAHDLDGERLSCAAVIHAPHERPLMAEATLRTLIEHVATDGTVTVLAEDTTEVATELDAGTTRELDAVGPVDLERSGTQEVICRIEVDF